MESNKNILLVGEIINNQWKVVDKIGEGTFSQIYSAYSLKDGKKVAIKVEAKGPLKPVLEFESNILATIQHIPYVCRYYYHGKHGNNTVLVMELLGDSMSKLRQGEDAAHGVPVSTCVSVGLQMLNCIEAFHKAGYVHRDIKASNFVRNEGNRGREYFLIDFGLSRQHIGPTGEVIPKRPHAEFRGTSMYASLASHRLQDLGRKDDLWSLLYLILDFLRGELPWVMDAQSKNRETVTQLKIHYTEENASELVDGVQGGEHLLAIMSYLKSLKYEDEPDYKFMREEIKKIGLMSENGGQVITGENKESTEQCTTEVIVDKVEFEKLSDVEKAEEWQKRAVACLSKDSSPLSEYEALLKIAKCYDTFFLPSWSTDRSKHLSLQRTVHIVEQKVDKLKSDLSVFLPPTIQSFGQKRESENKQRGEALRKRRERDHKIRKSLDNSKNAKDNKLIKQLSAQGNSRSSSPARINQPPISKVAQQPQRFVQSAGRSRWGMKDPNASPSKAPSPPPKVPPPPPPSSSASQEQNGGDNDGSHSSSPMDMSSSEEDGEIDQPPPSSIPPPPPPPTTIVDKTKVPAASASAIPSILPTAGVNESPKKAKMFIPSSKGQSDTNTSQDSSKDNPTTPSRLIAPSSSSKNNSKRAFRPSSKGGSSPSSSSPSSSPRTHKDREHDRDRSRNRSRDRSRDRHHHRHHKSSSRKRSRSRDRSSYSKRSNSSRRDRKRRA